MSPQTLLVGVLACGRQWRQLAQVFTGCSRSSPRLESARGSAGVANDGCRSQGPAHREHRARQFLSSPRTAAASRPPCCSTPAAGFWPVPLDRQVPHRLRGTGGRVGGHRRRRLHAVRFAGIGTCRLTVRFVGRLRGTGGRVGGHRRRRLHAVRFCGIGTCRLTVRFPGRLWGTAGRVGRHQRQRAVRHPAQVPGLHGYRHRVDRNYLLAGKRCVERLRQRLDRPLDVLDQRAFESVGGIKFPDVVGAPVVARAALQRLEMRALRRSRGRAERAAAVQPRSLSWPTRDRAVPNNRHAREAAGHHGPGRWLTWRLNALLDMGCLSGLAITSPGLSKCSNDRPATGALVLDAAAQGRSCRRWPPSTTS